MQEAHMSSPNTRTIAEEFFAAWTIDAFDNAEAYLAALRGLSQIVKGAEQQHVFVDGDDVCVIYDLITSTPAGSSPTAEWYHLRDGKISSVRVFFDARPFAAMFEQRGGN